MEQRQTQHWIGLGISLVALALFVFFGKGVVLYGTLMGVGMFTTMLLVGLKTPVVLKWANDHPALTEIGTTFGTFTLFQVFGGGTVTAGIASAIVCLLVSAILGCSKLGFLDRLIGQGLEHAETQFETIKDKFGSEEEDQEEPVQVKRKPRRSKRTVVQQALARAVQSSTRKSCKSA